tara:strand:- start:21422 stop:22159 length:738 start_codon:yes stop_codon:yes gene_type:complete
LGQPAFQLVRRDIRAQYAGSGLGLIWALLEPLILATAFIFLRHSGMITIGDITLPYAVYAVTSLMVWQTCVDGINGGLNSITRMRPLLKTTQVSAGSVVWVVILTACFFHLFRLVVALGVALAFGIHDPVNLLAYALLSFLAPFFGVAIGLLVAPFAELYRDLKILVSSALRPLLFVSGVIIPIPDQFSFLGVYNPIAVAISTARDALVGVGRVDYGLAGLWLAIMFIVFAIALFIFRRTLRIVL